MNYPELSRGDFGEAVKELQTFLNRVGAMLIVDGDFGSATDRGVRYAQDFSDQTVTGIANTQLWEWLEVQPNPFPPLASNGTAFIAKEETGGLWYYRHASRWPHFPGYQSGITIGVGYDLRFNSEADFLEQWAEHLPAATINELQKDIGKKGTKTRARALKRLGIEIPFKSAWRIFIQKTLPRFYSLTESIYPTLESLPDLCRSVLVSLVYNRGNSLNGSRRREMRAIRDILERASSPCLFKRQAITILTEVEDQLISMQRLWTAGSGLGKRRQAEANLWRTGLANW